MYYCRYLSPLGTLTLSSDGESLNGLWIEGQKYIPDEAKCCPDSELPVFRQTKEWLEIYFTGAEPEFMPPLAPMGSEFRLRVWTLLREIPFGGLTTYGELAKLLAASGVKASPRAVGGAVGHNPISILIPCHRVVGADGSLTGYGGGLPLKVALLNLEGADLSSVGRTGTRK